MSGYSPEVALDHALTSLSKARTALDDPAGLDERDHEWWEKGEANEFVIAMIDDAMRLLSPEKNEPQFALIVTLGDKRISTRDFDPEEEAIEAVGEALEAARMFPGVQVKIILGRVES